MNYTPVSMTLIPLLAVLAGCGPWEREGVKSIYGYELGPAPIRHTLKELRDQAVVKQELDYSCGSAALATLLRYYFGDQTSEEELLHILKTQYPQEEEWLKKQASGFSLLDLKQVALQKGYQAAGFRFSLEQVKQLKAPVIVHLEPMGYKHFAVLRGIVNDRAFVADPARGNLRLSLERFRSEWTGVVFVLGKPGEEDLGTYPLEILELAGLQPEMLRWLRITGPEPSLNNTKIQMNVR
ncbi:MAG: C39 family peptidase [Nitrospirales bacterium]|nr:C39 family peptidase [Nitrospirales bacterium]MBA3967418.1 C39 family peptidase [Nitrospirales bacterium]